MNAATAVRMRARAGAAANESFYALNDVDLRKARCCGLACFVARHLEKPAWEAADSQSERVYCLGRCYAAPADATWTGRPTVECPAPESIVLKNILRGGARSLERYRELGGYKALFSALLQPPNNVLEAVRVAQLRGRGGAGFPTVAKWLSASVSPGGEKFIIANGDEGDPGAYIDRFLMEDDPFAVLEGMTLAAYAIGAKRGWIYVRAEYPEAEASLRTAVNEARAAGFLGNNIFGSSLDFEVGIVGGKGSYLCGEETALIRSIEGLRPEAQTRPPYSSQKGLFGQPTVMNNIETLVTIPWIVLNTGEAFRSIGFSKSKGTKAVSLNSLFRRPGLYEVEFGITVRDIVEELGGGLKNGTIKGVIIGGPLAGVIPPELFDTPFGFEELHAIGASVGHGGVIAFDEQTSIPELVHHVFAFGAFESCGKCVPCRLGSRRIEKIFREIVEFGTSTPEADAEWRQIGSAMKMASLCAHGTGLAEFGESILRYYRKELAGCFV